MKIIGLIIFLSLTLSSIAQQRTVAECTIEYNITADSSSDMHQALNTSKKIVMIKGIHARTDISSPSFTQTTLLVKDTGFVTVLRIFGDNKVLTQITRDKWLHMNATFDSAVITYTNEQKKIIGYDCKMLLIELKSGEKYAIYYTPSIVTSVKDYEYIFKKIPGLVLGYEIQQKNQFKVNYTAVKISFTPVAASKMEIPKSGFRLLEAN
jgi:hypothetical protein